MSTLEIMVYGEIGRWGVSSASIAQLLKDNPDAKTIKLRVNSLGGSVFEGVAIHNLLMRHPARKEVDVDGVAASAATWIVMTGDVRRFGLGALFMIHEAHGWTEGPAEDHEKHAELLRKINAQQVDLYAARSKLSRAQITAAIAAETWYTADEAIKAGFATSKAALSAAGSTQAMTLDRIAAYGFKNPPAALERFMLPDALVAGPRAPLAAPLTPAQLLEAQGSFDLTGSDLAKLKRDDPERYAELRDAAHARVSGEARIVRNGQPLRAAPATRTAASSPDASTYARMTGSERAALKQRDPAKHSAMRDAWVAAGQRNDWPENAA
jgi:ATP-dependent protease ClpP protease subunit